MKTITKLTCARCLEAKERAQFPRHLISHRVQMCTSCKKIVTAERNQEKKNKKDAEWQARLESAQKLSNKLNESERRNNQKVTYSNETRTAILEKLEEIQYKKETEL